MQWENQFFDILPDQKHEKWSRTVMFRGMEVAAATGDSFIFYWLTGPRKTSVIEVIKQRDGFQLERGFMDHMINVKTWS